MIWQNPLSLALGFFLLLFAMEQRWPRRKETGSLEERARRFARNLGLALPYRMLLIPLVAGPLYLAALHVQPGLRGPLAHPVLGWIVDFALLDLVNFLTHWLAHKNPFFWRFHAVHHLDQQVDATTGLRVHVGEKLLFLPFKLAVFVLFSIPLAHIVSFEFVTLLNAMFNHANIRLPARFEAALSWFIATPGYQGVHHHAHLPYTDSNYAFVLPVWDHLFGTFSVANLDHCLSLGVNERTDNRVPESITELFLQPLRGPIAGTTLDHVGDRTST